MCVVNPCYIWPKGEPGLLTEDVKLASGLLLQISTSGDGTSETDADIVFAPDSPQGL